MKDQRTYDTPGRRELDKAQSVSIDYLSNGAKSLATWVKWGVGIMITLLTVIATSSFKNAVDIAAIKSNRFTSEAGLLVWQELGRKADAANMPPIEVREFMSETRRALENLNNKIEREREAHERVSH